jgi:hypothetical protein
MSHLFSRILPCLLAAAIAAGCGSSDNVTVYPVKGKVNFNGKPMVGTGAISLIPTDNQAGAAAGGEIKEDGSYELMTYKPGDGSMPGNFRVVVHQVVFQEGQNTEDGAAPSSAGVPPPVPVADRIPEIYSNPMNSPLTMKVEAKPNEINLELKSQ